MIDVDEAGIRRLDKRPGLRDLTEGSALPDELPPGSGGSIDQHESAWIGVGLAAALPQCPGALVTGNLMIVTRHDPAERCNIRIHRAHHGCRADPRATRSSGKRGAHSRRPAFLSHRDELSRHQGKEVP